MKKILIALLAAHAMTFSSGLSAQESSDESSAARPVIVVNKTPTCGCCSKWVDHLRANGFEVEVRDMASTRSVQDRLGVPRQLGSCHTAEVGDYWVEGHIPADIIQKLLDENRDDIEGIAVPGMPPGSPGMEAPNPVRYDVIAYGKDGKFYRFATVQGESG